MKTFVLLILPLVALEAWVPEMENPGLYQGDMVLTPEQQKEADNGNFGYASTKTRHWPKVIPYEFDSSMSSRARSQINLAINDYHKFTCLRFVQRTSQSGYISFYNRGGCSSPVGYSGRRNRISLANGCLRRGTILHEIAHSLGIYHEQSRPGRDKYVKIQWKNIRGGMDFNFKKQKASNIDSKGTPYDYRSMMHYGATAFGGGRITIETINPKMQNVIGQREGFSEIDKTQINLMYNCGNVATKYPPVVTKYPPVVTKYPPVVTGVPGCKDISINCQTFDRYCRNYSTAWTNYMKRSCRRTCRYC